MVVEMNFYRNGRNEMRLKELIEKCELKVVTTLPLDARGIGGYMAISERCYGERSPILYGSQ